MWLDYLKERFGYSSLVEEYGFASYTLELGTLFLQEIYIKPEFRRTGKGRELLQKLELIGKEHQCTRFWAQIWTNDSCCNQTLKASLGVGFKVVDANNNRMVLTKEIEG